MAIEAIGSALILKNNDLRDDQDTGSLRSPEAAPPRSLTLAQAPRRKTLCAPRLPAVASPQAMQAG
ncbi:MAG: hypothetical protein PHW60_15900 [Kiritimatiellae bacterium]|nr:hypothetical protein [Kiritimatiellia bacterium]